MGDGKAAAGGAASGAAGGATVGTAILPGWGTAIGAGVGAIAGGVSGFFGGGGGSSQKSGYTLPPEYELQYLDMFEQQMQQMQQDYQQAGMAFQAYDQKINALNEIITTGYKPEHFQAIQQSNFQLAQSLGKDAQGLVESGFITADDAKDLAEMQKVAAGEYEQVKNPVLEGQLNAQKRQLEQDLARSGVSPQQRAIALSQFDQSANEQRFGQAQQQFGLRGNLINQRAGLRQQGYGQATGTLQQGMGQAAQYMGAYGQMGANYASQYGAQNQTLQMQQGLRGEGREAFTTMGQFKFSKPTQQGIESGLVGPGSYYQQTGVARGEMGNYRNFIKTQERSSTLYGGDTAYGAPAFTANSRAIEYAKEIEKRQKEAAQGQRVSSSGNNDSFFQGSRTKAQ